MVYPSDSTRELLRHAAAALYYEAVGRAAAGVSAYAAGQVYAVVRRGECIKSTIYDLGFMCLLNQPTARRSRSS
jgi:hypothetical protein